MNNKTKIRKLKKIYIVIGGLLLFLLLFIAVGICFFFGKEKTNGETYPYNLGNGVVIEATSEYSGDFLEDGSDRQVKNVWALTVTNTSDQDIQFLRIKAEYKNESACFDITTLTAGSTVQVLESSAAEYPKWEEVCVYKIENLALFSRERSLYPEQFTVSAQDGWIKVENIGTEDIAKDIYVYFKNVEDGQFQGGITYRVKFEGGIPAGEFREEQSIHYREDTSRIMYLTYE